MPPRSPLPTRHGLQAAWVRTPDAAPTAPTAPTTPATLGAWLHERLAPRVDVAALLAAGRFVHADGTAVRGEEPYRPQVFVWFHRDLPVEAPVPGALHVVHRDERLVVVDKPPFLATVPRGHHVLQSVVVRLREELGLPELAPTHRLDRVTSGLLVCTTTRRWRGTYQSLWERRAVDKTYHALAPSLPLEGPLTVRDHVERPPGSTRARVVPGAPVNAVTTLQVERRLDDGSGLALYHLQPHTGRSHQLRLHLAGLGAPIVGDPLHPVERDVALDDFTTPLQLLASGLAFTDPVEGHALRLHAVRRLPLVAEG